MDSGDVIIISSDEDNEDDLEEANPPDPADEGIPTEKLRKLEKIRQKQRFS